jgi:hypothetical protein
VQVAGQPAQRGEQFAVQQRAVVQNLQRGAQFHARLRLAVPDHDAADLALAERHPQALPDRHRPCLRAGRRQVVEQARQRHRQGDAQHGKRDRHRASLAVAATPQGRLARHT